MNGTEQDKRDSYLFYNNRIIDWHRLLSRRNPPVLVSSL